jgi:hypothetical protein
MSDAKARWGKVMKAIKGKHIYGTSPDSPRPDQKKELDDANDDVKPEVDAWMKFVQSESDLITSHGRLNVTSPDTRAPRFDYYGAPDSWRDYFEKPRLPVKRPVRRHDDRDRDPFDTLVDYDMDTAADTINPWMEYKERGFNSICQYSYRDIDVWERQKEEEEANPRYTETTVLHSGHERHDRESSWNFDRGDPRERQYQSSLGHRTYGGYGYDLPNDTFRYGYSSAPSYGAATITVDSLQTPHYFVPFD